MQTREQTYIWAGAICALWIMTLFMVGDMFTETAPAAASAARENLLPSSAVMNSIDSALSAQPGRIFYAFSGAHENPFRSRSQEALAGARAAAPKHPACSLTLKGILDKQASRLAIIQDQSGLTVICKKGDTVCDMKVVNISASAVVLAGKKARQTLSLPDN